MNTTPKMYVLVRRDLETTYRVVQGSHAVIEYSFSEDPLAKELYKNWRNGTIIYLGVRNEQSLELWTLKLQDKKKTFALWREPDLKNQLTAIACIDTGEFFKSLNLV